MSLAALFTIANALALLCWLTLAGSLFLPRLRRRIWSVTGLAVPALLAVAYALLLPRGMSEAPNGGFASLEAVRTLFASDSALTAGWLHYLAFDLFVGTFIARDGIEACVPRLVLLPCLALTFLFGPAGLLLFLVIRFIAGRVRGQEVPP